MHNERPKRGYTKRIIIGVAIALALIFVVFLFITTNFLGNNMIVTETAYRATAYDVVKTTALVARDEEYISNTADGVLVYEIADGGKVTSGGAIATVYRSSDDAVAMQQIDELDEKIEYLESLNSSARSVNVGLDTVNNQLAENLTSLLGQFNARAFDYIEDAEDELMSAIFRKQIITGEQGAFDEKIAGLKAERDRLQSEAGSPVGTVKSPAAGYFVSDVDGYEEAVSVENLDTFYFSDYKAVEEKKIADGTYIGKIIKGVNWYLICPVTPDEATNISHNSTSVSVRMPYALSQEIPARVMYVNNLKDEDKAIVVLKCNYMSDALSKIRRESVEIVVNSYEGLKISKSAIHDDEVTRTVTDENDKTTKETKKVQGVYVEYGNELRFKQIVIKYAGDSYVICDETPDSEMLFNGDTITLYDQIVVEGGDLFDGKLIR